MATAGSKFYLKNAQIFNAGTNGGATAETVNGKILKAHASTVYKSRQSTSFAGKEFKSNNNFLYAELQRLRQTLRINGLEIPAIQRGQKQVNRKQINALVNTAQTDINLTHPDHVRQFTKGVFSRKIQRDTEAREFYNGSLEKNGFRSSALQRGTDTVPQGKFQDPEKEVFARSGRLSKATTKRKALDEDLAAQKDKTRRKKLKTAALMTLPNEEATYEWCNPDCREKKKPLEEHWGIHFLQQKSHFHNAKNRASNQHQDANLEFAKVFNEDDALNRQFYRLPIEMQGGWIALHQHATNHGCLVNPEAAEILAEARMAQLQNGYNEPTKETRLRIEGEANSRRLANEKIVERERRQKLLTGEQIVKEAEEEILRFEFSKPTYNNPQSPNRPLKLKFKSREKELRRRRLFSYVQRWKAELRKPGLVNSQVLAIRKRFIFRQMDLKAKNEGQRNRNNGQKWNKSKIISIISGAVREPELNAIKLGFLAFTKARESVDKMSELVGNVRILEAARTEPITKKPKLFLKVNGRASSLQKPPKKLANLRVQPLRAIPHHMRPLMVNTLTPITGVHLIDSKSDVAVVDDKTPNFIDGDKNNNRVRLVGSERNMKRRGKGDWNLGTLYDFSVATMNGKKAPELKRKSHLHHMTLFEGM